LDIEAKNLDPDREVEFVLYESFYTEGNPRGLSKHMKAVPASTEWHVSTRAVVVKVK
jgi:hypothetical protein